MRKEFVFHLYNAEHDNFMKLLDKCPADKRMTVPEGFNTSLYWHLGHVLRITEVHVYGLSQQAMSLPEHYKELFHYGTNAKDWTEVQLAELPAWDTMIAQLKAQRERIYDTLKDRLDEAVPENFKKAENFGELILTTSAHLSNHNGVAAALLQVLNK